MREGDESIALYTIGYEKRTGEELAALLTGAGVTVLADVREKPVSRVAAFRAGPLRSLCESVGVDYQGWPSLGSTEAQRARLKESGDFAAFARSFRKLAAAGMDEALRALAAVARKESVALLCYERSHDECHRSIIAERIAEENGAAIIAL